MDLELILEIPGVGRFAVPLRRLDDTVLEGQELSLHLLPGNRIEARPVGAPRAVDPAAVHVDTAALQAAAGSALGIPGTPPLRRAPLPPRGQVMVDDDPEPGEFVEEATLRRPREDFR